MGISQEDLQTGRFASLFQAGMLGDRGVGQNLMQLLAIRAPRWEGGDLDSLLPAGSVHFA